MAIQTGTARATIPVGFDSPGPDAQKAFRALMQALAFPGRIVDVAALPGTPPGWPPALAAAVLALLDADTPVWLDGGARSPEASGFIGFHAGAPVVDRPEEARFAVILDAAAAPYEAFQIGVDQYPDRSATLFVATPALTGGEPAALTGPGVQTVQTAAPAGSMDRFWTAWRRNQALYPLGYDAFLFAGRQVMGLPRSAQATLQER